MSRAQIETELGDEVICSKCNDYWPADSKFFYFNKGRPHSWCKACYVNDRGCIKRPGSERFVATWLCNAMKDFYPFVKI